MFGDGADLSWWRVELECSVLGNASQITKFKGDSEKLVCEMTFSMAELSFRDYRHQLTKRNRSCSSSNKYIDKSLSTVAMEVCVETKA